MKYKDVIKNIIKEEMVAGGEGSVFGDLPQSSVQSGDEVYAPGDARIPYSIYGNRKWRKKKNKRTGKKSVRIMTRPPIKDLFLNAFEHDEVLDNAILECQIILNKNTDTSYIKVVEDILTKHQEKYTVEDLEDRVIIKITNTDENITKIVENISTTFGPKFMDNNVLCLIGEVNNGE